MLCASSVRTPSGPLLASQQWHPANEVKAGFDPKEYPGEGAFFASDRTIAEGFNKAGTHQGLQEIQIPRKTFDKLVHDGVIEVDGYYQSGRSWQVKPDRLPEFNEAVRAGADKNQYHPQ